jgi:hypothetical protein
MTLAAMKRHGALLVVLVGSASGVLLVSSAAGSQSGALTLSVSGPTDAVGIPAPRYVIAATIDNGTSSTAAGVTLSSSFPDSDAREEITGVTGCDDSALNLDVCTVPDIPAGHTAIVTIRYAPTEYGIDRHHLIASSAGLDASDEADFDVRVSGPPASTDWRVVVTPAVGIGGLRARHEVVVTNLGPAAAANAVLDEQLQTGEQLVSTSLGPACAIRGADVLHCSLGTLAGRESATVAVDTKLPPNPGEAFHVVDVGSDTPDVNDSHLFGSAPAVSGWRYWICAACASTTFSDGYELPSAFTVGDDETVHLDDGSVVRRDGVLARADGKLVLADGTITSPPASPPDAPTDVTAAAADGQAAISFTEPPSNGFPITSYTVTASPGGYVYTGTGSPIAAVGLTNGTSYTFTVRASNGAGPGPASAPSGAVTPLAVPAPPATVTAEGGDGQGTVSFSSSPSGAVAYYTVTAFPGGRTANGTESPITVAGLKNGATYSFSVSATNASGQGPESVSSNSVVPASNPRPDTDPPTLEEPRPAPPNPPAVPVPRPPRPGH